MEKEDKIGMRISVNALIERFDDLEKETGRDFSVTKRVILRWAERHKLFSK
mgnify:CR=1 FL=1